MDKLRKKTNEVINGTMYIRTVEQDIKEIGISIEKYYNVIEYIYDKTQEEMEVLARVLKDNTNRNKLLIQRAFERVLDINGTILKEVRELYYN